MQLTFSEALSALRSPSPGAVGFAARTTIAVLLALFWAFALQLESPGWAPTTAIVLASPFHGQVISKGIYRLVGTITGAIGAVMIVALFAQTPELCILVVALWIGGWMYAATLLRNYVAYGAMLAGFSASVIVLGSLPDHPLRVVDIAFARVAAITLGILATALVAAVLTPGGATRQMNKHLRRLLVDFTVILRKYSAEDFVPQVGPRRRALAGEIIALDSLIVFASAETFLVRQQREGLIGIGAALMHSLTAVGGTGFAYHRMTEEQRLNRSFQAGLREAMDAGRLIEEFLAGPDHMPAPSLMPHAQRVRQMAVESTALTLASSDRKHDSIVAVALHRIRETLEHLHLALAGYAEWRNGRDVDTPPRVRFAFYADSRDAILNGTRCFLLILAAGAFWMLTAWPSGGFLLSLVAAYVCVASVQKNPVAFGPPFLTGVLIALPFVGWLIFVPMSMIEGYVPLCLVLGTPVFLGALAWGSFDKPRVSGAGFAFLLMLILLLSPSNPTTFDMGAYLNNALATLVAMILSVASSIFLLPLAPRRRAHRLIRTMCCEVEELLDDHPDDSPSRAEWESLMYDRLCGSMPFLSNEAREAEILSSAFAALQIGASVIDIRQALASTSLESAAPMRPTIEEVLSHLSDLGLAPARVAKEMHGMGCWLSSSHMQNRTAQRIAISLEGIALLLDSYGDLFRQVRREVEGMPEPPPETAGANPVLT